MQITDITLPNLPRAKSFVDRIVQSNYIVTRDDFFKWQFIESACVAGIRGKTGALMILNKDQVVGISLAVKSNMRFRGKTIDGAWHQEWYADEDYFGVGFLLLKEQLTRHFFFGVSGQSLQAANVFQHMRRTCWFEIPRLFIVCDALRTHKLLFSHEPATLDFLKQQCIIPPKANVRMESIDHFGEAYDRSWQQLRDRFLLTVDRTSSYMQWRYCDHPYFKYQKMCCKTDIGDVYFVWREEEVREHDICVARICDIMGTPEAVVEAFPSFYGMLMEHGNIAFADFMCSNAELNAALLYSGMREVITLPDFDLPRLFSPLANDVRKRLNFAYSLPDKVGMDFFQTGLTYFTKGDTNQDRPNST